ncbi:hypothetical protein LBMAG21_08320 [Armatimonadota bacterium]|nr:hypothetical protein LBMAG21_08320 [Armatimonadota bacterium]
MQSGLVSIPFWIESSYWNPKDGTMDCLYALTKTPALWQRDFERETCIYCGELYKYESEEHIRDPEAYWKKRKYSFDWYGLVALIAVGIFLIALLTTIVKFVFNFD